MRICLALHTEQYTAERLISSAREGLSSGADAPFEAGEPAEWELDLTMLDLDVLDSKMQSLVKENGEDMSGCDSSLVGICRMALQKSKTLLLDQERLAAEVQHLRATPAKSVESSLARRCMDLQHELDMAAVAYQAQGERHNETLGLLQHRVPASAAAAHRRRSAPAAMSCLSPSMPWARHPACPQIDGLQELILQQQMDFTAHMDTLAGGTPRPGSPGHPATGHAPNQAPPAVPCAAGTPTPSCRPVFNYSANLAGPPNRGEPVPSDGGVASAVPDPVQPAAAAGQVPPAPCLPCTASSLSGGGSRLSAVAVAPSAWTPCSMSTSRMPAATDSLAPPRSPVPEPRALSGRLRDLAQSGALSLEHSVLCAQQVRAMDSLTAEVDECTRSAAVYKNNAAMHLQGLLRALEASEQHRTQLETQVQALQWELEQHQDQSSQVPAAEVPPLAVQIDIPASLAPNPDLAPAMWPHSCVPQFLACPAPVPTPEDPPGSPGDLANPTPSLFTADSSDPFSDPAPANLNASSSSIHMSQPQVNLLARDTPQPEGKGPRPDGPLAAHPDTQSSEWSAAEAARSAVLNSTLSSKVQALRRQSLSLQEILQKQKFLLHASESASPTTEPAPALASHFPLDATVGSSAPLLPGAPHQAVDRTDASQGMLDPFLMDDAGSCGSGSNSPTLGEAVPEFTAPDSVALDSDLYSDMSGLGEPGGLVSAKGQASWDADHAEATANIPRSTRTDEKWWGYSEDMNNAL
eukprot:gene2494-519_t